MKNTKALGFGKRPYHWKRLSELYKPGEINIIKEPAEIKNIPDILCSDVLQGEIGDCYYLSVLSSFAENPKRIKNLFPTVNVSPNGAFEAKVYLHGEPIRVVVDDYFPCIEKEDGTFEIAFTGLNEKTKNAWVMILEKIWAKVNFAYENIIAGVPSDAFQFLSPSPIEDYNHKVHKDLVFKKISEASKRNFIITCAIIADNNSNLKHLAEMGLVANHAYAILDCV